MNFERLAAGAMLTRNVDGSPKERAVFWQPSDGRLIVPAGDDLHRRPIIQLHTRDSAYVALIVFYQDRIEGFANGQSKRLVNFR